MDTLKEQAKDWQGQVEVAVIDSGIDRDHELFTGRIDTEKSINLSGQLVETLFASFPDAASNTLPCFTDFSMESLISFNSLFVGDVCPRLIFMTSAPFSLA